MLAAVVIFGPLLLWALWHAYHELEKARHVIEEAPWLYDQESEAVWDELLEWHEVNRATR